MKPPKINDKMPLDVMIGNTKTGAALGLNEADGDREGDRLKLGEPDAEGLRLDDALELRLREVEGETLSDMLADGEILSDALALGDKDGD